MHFHCPPGLPCAKDPDCIRSTRAAAKGEDAGPLPQSHGRPFIERRRRADIHSSWPEALDCLHHHLAGLQVSNEQLRQSEQKYKAFFEEAPIGLFQSTSEGQPVLLNMAMARLLGYDSTEHAFEDFAKGTPPLRLDPSQWPTGRGSCRGSDVRSVVEMQVQYPDGAKKWLRFHVHAIRDRGRIMGYQGAAEDITWRKQAELRTEFLAYYDPLTGLPNRTSFFKQFADVLVTAHDRHGRAALLLVEFDRFKFINDSLGDQFGDRLLQEIADRIKAAAGSRGTVSRLSGAEFAILLRNPGNGAIPTTARKIVNKLGNEYSLLGHSLTLLCHMGISVFPDHGADCETLMKRADAAICSARETGGNSVRVFSAELNDQLQERLKLENGLREALKRNELYLEYQPQVDIRTGSVTGLEALLRWKHKEMGLIPPSRFIAVAENCGLIVPIGEWVLRNACYQAREWHNQGCLFESVAVNVSAVQFRQQGFCELVRRVLKETGLKPELLELELTETLLLTNADVMSTVIGELRQMGVRVAIDDFGTGYSSLGYLKQFKVNRLKIARSFVQDVSVDSDDAAIITAIIEMAKAMNLSVLAEGVENEAQLSFFQSQQCYTIQGFYFSRPIGVHKIDTQLRTGYRHLIPARHP